MIKNSLMYFSFIILLYIALKYDNFTIILSGIAIFLIGMFFMQDGFKQLSGGILDKLLQKFTKNNFYSIITGFISTSIVQSSTIITLVVISFLSANLMSLTQGIGIIFGSNLGSTTTAWIVSSLGVDVKISKYAFIMIVFGVILRFSKSNNKKGIGNVLLGLGFIFLGIAYMKDGFDIIKESINLSSYAIDGYFGIIVYIIIGILITVVIQSSAATLAIVITALNSDSISYISALSLAIGANVGTTLTAILASFTSNENGKRVAFAHFVFNISSAIFVTIFIFQFEDIVDFLAKYLGISENNFGMKLALFHTLFSIIGIVILTPFINQLVILSKKLIKDKIVNISNAKFLLKSNLDVPDAAIASIKHEIIHLYENSQKAMLNALNIDHNNLTKETLNKQLNSEFKIININIDEIYQNDIKNLYSQIIKYSSFAQENMMDFQNEKVRQLTKCASLIIEVLKDIRGIQKNVNIFLVNKNEYIKKEYNIIRKEISDLIIDINELENIKSHNEKAQTLKKLKIKLGKNDLKSSKEISKFIREEKIKSNMATSYINDSATSYSIQKKLIKVAYILFTIDDDEE